MMDAERPLPALLEVASEHRSDRRKIKVVCF